MTTTQSPYAAAVIATLLLAGRSSIFRLARAALVRQ
jgi:hypothetical protein